MSARSLSRADTAASTSSLLDDEYEDSGFLNGVGSLDDSRLSLQFCLPDEPSPLSYPKPLNRISSSYHNQEESSGDSMKVPDHQPNQWLDDTIDSKTPRRSGYRVAFEIISAKTVCQDAPRKKYVSYSILVKRVPGLETHPGVVERRYSDFLSLYQSLRKRFPNLLNDFPFPKKTLVGNFTPEVITERSVAFQHLLAFCLSIRELRQTNEFADFLFHRELKDVTRLMRAAQFEEASNILENVFYIEEKLWMHTGDHNLQLFQTLCVLIATLNAVDNVGEAQKFAEKAFELISESDFYDSSELIVPLVVLSTRLWWSVGKDKQPLEVKLAQLRQTRAINLDKQSTLLELVLRKDFSIYANNNS